MTRVFALALVVLTGCTRPEPTAAAPAVEDPKTLALASLGGETKLDAAVRHAQSAARRADASPDPWVQLAYAWIRKARSAGDPGFYLSAGAAAEVAFGLSPGFAPAVAVKGIVLLNQHRFAEAKALAAAALTADPDDLVALGTLSDALLELGDVPGAVDAAQRMVDLKPSLPAYGRASYLAWLNGEATRAKELARLAIDSGRDLRDPEPLAWTLVQAAHLFWHEGDLPGADAGYDQALAVLPAYPPALAGKGRVALARGDAAAAETALAAAFAASPLVETAALLSEARAMRGDGEGARRAEAEAVRVGRRGDGLALATVLTRPGRDAAEALRLVDREAAARRSLAVLDARAWALFRLGRFAEARADIDRATRLGTPDARLSFHAGAIRLAQGDAAGLGLVREALALNPAFDPVEAPEARRLLLAHGGARATR